MKKKVVFRCQFGGSRYVTYEEPSNWDQKKMIYVTYVDRRKLGGGYWLTLEGAIGHILTYLDGFKLETFKTIWS